MSIFAIADLHLSLGTSKPMDIFPGWDNYVSRVEENWRKIVNEDDTVVIAGDISWAMKLEETKNDFDFLHSLPGKKLLLKGNHDYWWSTKAKINNYFKENDFYDMDIIHNSCFVVGDYAICGTRGWMYNSVSDEDIKIVNREAGRLKSSIQEAIKLKKKPLVFLHYPPVYDNFACDILLSVMKEYGIDRCYFGHIHGKNASQKIVTGDYDGIKMELIACDYQKFIPLLVEKA
ncbi:MAG: metallophosphoesterase [Clostridia bacterium]